jgi:hypothetical protein
MNRTLPAFPPCRRTLPLLALAAALLLACAPAARADAPASDPGGITLRAWGAVGPYWPAKDEGHWLDPRGTGVVLLGIGGSQAPTMYVGAEGVAWLASYNGRDVSNAFVPSNSRMTGVFTAFGPMARAMLTHGRWEPYASFTLLIVRGKLSWSGAALDIPGSAALEGRWAMTAGLGAGVSMRLGERNGIGLRYEGIPLKEDFGPFSNGSAKVGVQTVMLNLYTEFGLSRGRHAH